MAEGAAAKCLEQLAVDGLTQIIRLVPQNGEARGKLLADPSIDLSDGLAGDLGHVLTQSRVGALLEWALLPRSSTLSALPLPLQRQCVLGGGDDYELLFSAPASGRAAVQRAAARAEVAVSRVGEVQAEPGLRVRWLDGSVLPWTARGFDHFASDDR